MSVINRDRRLEPRPPVDFVIITALEEEREALLSMLGDYVILDKGDADIHTYYFAELQTDRRDQSRYQVIVTCLINMGPITATAQTVTVINRWKPRYVLLVGIACGIEGEVCHGDVIVASQVADYTLGKQAKGKRQVRWEVFPCGASLLDSSNNIRGKWYERIGVPRPIDGKPIRHKGVVASGGDVIQGDKIIATYSKSWPKLIGIEMESGGVAAGVHQTAERPEFLMVKGVSDFGEDKHDPKVKPWREYACHSSAAFAISLIKSGPARSLSEIEGTSLSEQDEQQEQRRAAERQWGYIQQHKIRKLEFFFLLKENVGQEWFRTLLDNSSLNFEHGMFLDGHKTFKLGTLTSTVAVHNQPSKRKNPPEPSYDFWSVYDKAPGYWCRNISPEPEPMEYVAGISGVIPWEILELDDIETLQDLAQLTRVGITLPINAFEVGVEEFELRFVGDTFHFTVSLEEDGILPPLHEFCQMQHTVIDEPDKRMPLGTGFTGVSLLDRFLKQFLQQHSVLPKPERKHFPMGFCGPNGHEIHFYPDAPKDFSHSPEMEKYSFKITTQKRDFAPAIEEAEKALQANPENTANYVTLARLYFAQGRFLDAIQCLKRAINEALPNGDVHELMGVLLSKLGRNTEAIDHLRQALIFNPESASIHTALGIALSESTQFPEAINHFRKVVDLNPSDIGAHSNLGLSLAKNGQYEEAITHLERATDSRQRWLLKLLAALIGEVRNKEEARPYLERAAHMEPPDAGAWADLGSNYALCKEPEKAVECYRHAISIDDTNARTHEFLGASLADLGRWEEAEKSMRRALELAPTDARVHMNLGAVLANLGQMEEARTLQQRAIELDVNILGSGDGTEEEISQPTSEIEKEDGSEPHEELGDEAK